MRSGNMLGILFTDECSISINLYITIGGTKTIALSKRERVATYFNVTFGICGTKVAVWSRKIMVWNHYQISKDNSVIILDSCHAMVVLCNPSPVIFHMKTIFVLRNSRPRGFTKSCLYFIRHQIEPNGHVIVVVYCCICCRVMLQR